MTKEIHVTMPDGSVWAVDANLVAEPRARYYAEVDARTGANFDEVYAHEMATQDAEDLIDWAHNNMNWEDVQANARLVVTPDSHVDYQEGWVNGEMRLIG